MSKTGRLLLGVSVAGLLLTVASGSIDHPRPISELQQAGSVPLIFLRGYPSAYTFRPAASSLPTEYTDDIARTFLGKTPALSFAFDWVFWAFFVLLPPLAALSLLIRIVRARWRASHASAGPTVALT